jgi:hypothetical protein
MASSIVVWAVEVVQTEHNVVSLVATELRMFEYSNIAIILRFEARFGT